MDDRETNNIIIPVVGKLVEENNDLYEILLKVRTYEDL